MSGRETTIYDRLTITVNGLFKLLFFLVGKKTITVVFSTFIIFSSFSQPVSLDFILNMFYVLIIIIIIIKDYCLLLFQPNYFHINQFNNKKNQFFFFL